MSHWRATQPRAAVALCWICDRRLYAGGRSYVTIKDEQGHEHPAHRQCVTRRCSVCLDYVPEDRAFCCDACAILAEGKPE